MQWIQLFLWGSCTFWASRKARRARAWSLILCAGLLLSMGTQLYLLWEVDRLDIETAAPLHLCSFSALLCLPMLLNKSQGLFQFVALLGAPAAFLPLAFPAIAHCNHPTLMALSFFRLHTLILCSAFLMWLQGFPLPTRPRAILLAANAYLLAVAVFNRFFHTNYLFLYRAPYHTPLAFLAAQGSALYLLSLEMGALLLVSGLSWLYGRLPRKHAPLSAKST